jgi:hypothetical protein
MIAFIIIITLAILISGKYLNTVIELLQEALSIVQQWCDRVQLSVNPQKQWYFHLEGREI